MPIFKLNCEVTVSAYTEVEADTLEQAIEISESRGVELDFNGSGQSANESWLVEAADGAPTNIHEA